jgi:RND family efflux transporter MFP subunit
MNYLIALMLVFTLAAGCTAKDAKKDAHEGEAFAATGWSKKTEVHAEFTEPKANAESDVELFITRLEDFKPLPDGSLILEVQFDDTAVATVAVEKSTKPGVFKAKIPFKQAGLYSLKVTITGKDYSDSVYVDDIDVHDATGAQHAHAEEKGGSKITYLKTQQWMVDFRTALPDKGSLNASYIASGEIVPAAGADATVTAPFAGVVAAGKEAPFVGRKVKKGDVIAVIEPPLHQQNGLGQLQAAHAEARQKFLLAQKEHDRAQRLYDVKAAPRRRVEEAQLALESSRIALAPLAQAMGEVSSRTRNGKLVVTAPMSGTVVEVFTPPGKAVEAGAQLARVVDASVLWVKANVPATAVASLKDLSQTTFKVNGMDGTFKPSRVVSANDLVDAKSRSVAVLFEIPNAGGRLRVGMYADVALSTGSVADALTLPEEALFEDEGRSFVFVQKLGESFERREVKTGLKGEGRVQITGGLDEDERVVVRGGYYVKLASVSSRIPQGDGHAH